MRGLLLIPLLLAGCLDSADPVTTGNRTAADGNAPAAFGADENATAAVSGANSTAAPAIVAEGTIALGSPTTGFRSTNVLQRDALGSAPADGLDSFFVETLPAAGAWLWTETTSEAAAPYDVNVYFRDANWTYIDAADCATSAAEEACAVPDGAVHANVDAAAGARLTVRLWTGPRPAS